MHACVSYYTLSILRKCDEKKIPRWPTGKLFNWWWELKRELFSLRWHSAGLPEFYRVEQTKYVAFTQRHSGVETKGRRATSGISLF